MLRSVDTWEGEHFAFGEADASPGDVPTSVAIENGADGPSATIPDAHLLFTAQFARAGADLVLHGEDGKVVVVQDYFAADQRARLLSPEGAALSPEIVDALAGPQAPGQFAQAAATPPAQQAVGRVAVVTGDATIVRNGVAMAANAGDPILKGDVLQTVSGTIGVTFSDGSTLNLTANTRLVVNEFVYDPRGSANSQLLDLVQGSLTFISGEIAHNGDMRIGTPVATMGIRGTVGGVTTASDGTVNFYVSQSTTGAVILDSRGTIIANVVQDGPLIIVRPVGPLQVIAEEVQKSPAQLATELAALQQIVNIQSVGQQIIQQFFQQNPNNPNPNPQATDKPLTQIQIFQTPNSTPSAGDAGTNNDAPPPFNAATMTTTTPNPDGTQTTQTQTVTFFPNVAPVAPPISVTTDENGAPVTIDGLANASDAEGDALHIENVVLTATGVQGQVVYTTNGNSITVDPTQFAYLDAGEHVTLVANYNVVDSHGASVATSATLTVNGVNDAPVIVSDGGGSSAAISVAENTTAVTTVQAIDVDSSAVTYSIVNGAGSPDAALFAIDAQTGALSFVQAPDFENPADAGHDNSYIVQVRASDGSLTDVQTLNISVNDVADALMPTASSVTVSEEGLSNGNADTFGTTDTTNVAISNGAIAVTGGGESLTFALGVPETNLTFKGSPLSWSGSGTGTLTGSVGDTDVIAITIDSQGNYQVTLKQPVDHPDGDTEDVVSLNVPVTVSSGQQSATTMLTVGIEDDSPRAVNHEVSTSASVTQDFNVAFALDYSGSINNAELNTMLGAVKTAAQSLFEGTTGDVSITVVAFAGSAASLGTFTSYSAFAAAIDSTNPQLMGSRPNLVGGTNFDAAVQQVIAHFTPVEGTHNEVFFLSDGQSSVSSQATAWNNFVDSNEIGVTAVGIGDGISNSGLQSVDVDGSGSPILVAQFSDLVESLLELVAPETKGNVLRGGSLGGDGGRILSITVDGQTYTWNGYEGEGAFISTGGENGSSGTYISLTTALGGAFTFYFAAQQGHAAGDWTYTPPEFLSGPENEVFHYTLTDNDGDNSGADITISVTAENYTLPVETADLSFNGYEDVYRQIDFDVLEGSGLARGFVLDSLPDPSAGYLQIIGANMGDPEGIAQVGVEYAAGSSVYFLDVPNWNGTSEFLYHAVGVDGQADATPATITLNWAPSNDAPVAVDDTPASVAEDSGLRIISFASLLGNDSKGPANESGQTLTITAIANVVGGTAVINGTNIEFTLAANFNGTASFDYTVRDNGQTNGADDFRTDTGSVSFSVTPVNDAPVNSVPGARTVSEDTDLFISGLSISDADAGGANVTTTLSVAHGTLTVAAAGGATVSGSGTDTVTLSGTVSQINATLAASNNIAYRSAQDYSGSDTLTVTTNDGGHTGGSALSDTDTVAITVTPVADTPTLLGPLASAASDDFNGASLDTSQWNVYLPTMATENQDPSVTQTGGVLQIHDRGYLQTVDGFTPSTATPLHISLDWTFQSIDYLHITDRTDGVTEPVSGGTINGVTFLAGWQNTFGIYDTVGATSVTTTFSFVPGTTYHIEITDDGAHQSFVISDLNGMVLASVQSDYNRAPAGTLVTITNREGNDGQHTLTIDNLTISSAYGGMEDNAVTLSGLTAALTDPSEILSLSITGFPAGATFSAGSLVDTNNDTLADTLLLSAAEIAGLASTPLSMTPPSNYNGNFTLHVSATSTESDNSSASVSRDFAVSIAAVNDKPALTGSLAASVGVGLSHILTTQELSFADPDDGAADVTFTVANQQNGSLQVAGNAATSFTGQQLTNGQVSFVHDGSSTLSAGFTVAVEDGNEDGSAPVADTFEFSTALLTFEAGLGGWATTGAVTTTTAQQTEGASSASLTSNNGAGASAIESFLGIAQGSLQGMGNGSPHNGAAMSVALHLGAGDTFTFDWKFTTTEVPNNGFYNDFAFFSNGPSSVIELADTWTAADTWHEASFVASAAGDYVFGFGVVNVNDPAGQSSLFIDHLRIDHAMAL